MIILMSFFHLGLLTHMEHMRMDPKHQFAAQYVLSRAAAERRDRELLAGSSLGTLRYDLDCNCFLAIFSTVINL